MHASMMLVPALLALVIGIAGAESLALSDGLEAKAAGPALSEIALDGAALKGVSVWVAVLDPQTGEPARGIDLDAAWSSEGGALALRGELRAEGQEDRAQDDLFAISARREVLQAQQSLAALVAHVARLQVSFPGERVGIPGDRLAAVAPYHQSPPDVARYFFTHPAHPAPRLHKSARPSASLPVRGPVPARRVRD